MGPDAIRPPGQMPSTADPAGLDLPSLRAFAAAGGDPRRSIALAQARLAAAADPGIFLDLTPPEALEAAVSALPPFDPARTPLWGVPVAVKDNIDVAGRPTTAGCPAFARVAERDAEAVARLRAAGALVLGKTNLDQFATGLVGLRTPYPAPRNPFDPARVPGGSSSGSAVAVARGIVAAALGTDTAGSGRVPAAFNGVVGLKPSPGAVSSRGVVPACRSLDCVSVFAPTVADAWAVFAAIAGEDAADPFSRPVPVPALQAVPPPRVIGVPAPGTLLPWGDGQQEAAWGAALALAAGCAARVEAVDITPLLATARLLYDGPWVAERAAAVGEFVAAHPDAVHPVTRGIIEGAARYSAADAFRGFHALAEAKRATAPIWRRVELLVLPSVPASPTVAEVLADPLGPNARLGGYTNFVNLLDLAALALPGPPRADGFPAGITLIGPHGSDARLAAFGALFEAARDAARAEAA
jgi:allophanate hydrolase